MAPRTYLNYVVSGPIPGVRTHHGIAVTPDPASLPAQFAATARASTESPFVGITSDGTVVPDVYSLEPSGVDNSAVVAAANKFLDSMTHPDQRSYVQQPVEHWQRRSWFNGPQLWMPEGILLEDLEQYELELAMNLARTALGDENYEFMRNVMRTTDNAGKVWNFYSDFMREYSMWVTIWGQPNNDGEPWGFQFSGLHFVVNALYVGDQLTLEPYFFGAELKYIDRGPYAGLVLFQDEENVALALGATLTDEQKKKAVVYASMLNDDLPPERAGFIDGRQVIGAGRDNSVVPYEGITAAEMTEDQRELFRQLLEVYLRRFPEGGHREQRRAQVMRYFDDETYISYIGNPAQLPFYYRIQSPSIAIEYDNHPGLGFEGDLEAIPEHVHTISRMPNGGDYGSALLNQWRDK